MSEYFLDARLNLQSAMPPLKLLVATVQFLLEGDECRAGRTLALCSIEYGVVRCQRGSVYEIDITLRCSREVYEKLKPDRPATVNFCAENSKLMLKVTEAVKASLPSGYGIANLEARIGAPVTKSEGKGDVESAHGEESTAGNSQSKFQFKKSGNSWVVVFESKPLFHIPDTLGAKYLNHLLHNPNEPISASDLEMAIQPEKANSRHDHSIQNQLDAVGMKNYLRQLSNLRASRDEAVEQGDHGRTDHLDTEIETIEAEVRNKKVFADAGERARDNVRKAIAAVRKKLLQGDKNEKAFGKHIEQFIDTGYMCLYSQDRGRIWG